jgi:hypothetical protein
MVAINLIFADTPEAKPKRSLAGYQCDEVGGGARGRSGALWIGWSRTCRAPGLRNGVTDPDRPNRLDRLDIGAAQADSPQASAATRFRTNGHRAGAVAVSSDDGVAGDLGDEGVHGADDAQDGAECGSDLDGSSRATIKLDVGRIVRRRVERLAFVRSKRCSFELGRTERRAARGCGSPAFATPQFQTLASAQRP